VGHAKLGGGGALKGGYRLAKNELLRLKDAGQGIEEFLVNGAVLTLQVQHWDTGADEGWADEAGAERVCAASCT
jgi:hypothetical protein